MGKKFALFAVAALVMGALSFGATAAYAQVAVETGTITTTQAGTAAGTNVEAAGYAETQEAQAYETETAGTENYGATLADTGGNPLAFMAAGFALCGLALLLIYRGRKSAIDRA